MSSPRWDQLSSEACGIRSPLSAYQGGRLLHRSTLVPGHGGRIRDGTRADWKTTPLPAAREAVALDRTYTAAEFERLKQGNVPKEMEDKWFAFFEEPWLYLHRSWTGFCIYQVRFVPASGGRRIAEVLVSRDPDQYRETDAGRDAQLVALLLDGYAGRDTEAGWKRYTRVAR